MAATADTTLTPTAVPTFEALAALEPGLAGLLAEARASAADAGDPHFCANAVWYGYEGHPGIKQRLLRLVGWERSDRHPVLSTPCAYDVAYEHIYEMLPPCRDCACL
jgi:hypothetical protein